MEHVRAFIELAVELGSVIQTTDPEKARATRPRPYRQSDDAAADHAAAWPRPARRRAAAGGDARRAAATGRRHALLDDQVGYRFAVLGESRSVRCAAGRDARHARRTDVVLVIADRRSGRPISPICMPMPSSSVPTGYILGIASTPAELDAVMARRQWRAQPEDISQADAENRRRNLKSGRHSSWTHLVFRPIPSIMSAA